MANKKNSKPFNLLYKFDAQKTGIDKLYDFVTVEGRYIVVCVMFVIVLAFIYRFPLDKKLNDEINRATENITELDFYAGAYEKNYRDIIDRTQAAKNFVELYPETFDITTQTSGQIRFADLLKKVNEIVSIYNNDVILVDYSYSGSPSGESILKVTGSCTTFAKADEFREKIKAEKMMVSEVIINQLSATKDGTPKFSLDIKIKNPA
jgi:hypothetical protein